MTPNTERAESLAAVRGVLAVIALVLMTSAAALVLSWAGDAAGIVDGRLIVGVLLAAAGVRLAGRVAA